MISYEPLRDTLKSKGINFSDLAKGIKKVEGRLRVTINNQYYVSTALLEKICRFLKCTPNDVIKFVRDVDFERRVNVDWDKVKKLKTKTWLEYSKACKLSDNSLSKAYQRRSTLDHMTFNGLCKALGCEPEDIAAARKDSVDSTFKDFVDGVIRQKEPIGDDFPTTYDDNVEPVVRRESGPSVDKTLEKLGLTKGLATPASPEDSKRIGQKFIDEYLEGKK